MIMLMLILFIQQATLLIRMGHITLGHIFGLNVSSADERWFYAKLESRAVRGEKK